MHRGAPAHAVDRGHDIREPIRRNRFDASIGSALATGFGIGLGEMPAFNTAIDHDLDAVDPHPGVAFLRLHPPRLDAPARLFPALQPHTGNLDGVAERPRAGFRHAQPPPGCGPHVTFAYAWGADRRSAVADG